MPSRWPRSIQLDDFLLSVRGEESNNRKKRGIQKQAGRFAYPMIFLLT